MIPVAVEVFAMLADETRVRLILTLAEGESSVNRLAEQLGRNSAAVSQHLAKLRMAHMVAARHEGSRVIYRLVDEHALDLVRSAMLQADHATNHAPVHHRQVVNR